MPGARVFIDANVFIYTVSEASAAKSAQARHWLRMLTEADSGRTNLQVLNEVTNVLLRKRPGLTPLQAFSEVDQLRPFGTSPIDQEVADDARQVRIDTSYSWWDCLLLTAAIDLGCTHFLSEDLQDGQIVSLAPHHALTIINPFAHSPEQILTQ